MQNIKLLQTFQHTAGNAQRESQRDRSANHEQQQSSRLNEIWWNSKKPVHIKAASERYEHILKAATQL